MCCSAETVKETIAVQKINKVHHNLRASVSHRGVVADNGSLDCEYATSTKDLLTCAKQEYDHEIHRLNDAYKQLKELRPNGFDALRAAQRAYIEDRDLTCKWQAQIFYEDGTAQPLAEIGCLTQMERARADKLADMVRYLGGL